MNKLIMSTSITKIGHSLSIILILLMFSSCRLFETDDLGDYWYVAKIKNNTNETLLVILGEEPPIVDSLFIIPDSSVSCRGGMKVYKGQDVIKELLFTSGYRPLESRARVLRGDSVLVDWHGPAEDKGELHHFYNYNSWKSWLKNERDGIVEFTIYESDLQGN